MKKGLWFRVEYLRNGGRPKRPPTPITVNISIKDIF